MTTVRFVEVDEGIRLLASARGRSWPTGGRGLGLGGLVDGQVDQPWPPADGSDGGDDRARSVMSAGMVTAMPGAAFPSGHDGVEDGGGAGDRRDLCASVAKAVTMDPADAPAPVTPLRESGASPREG